MINKSLHSTNHINLKKLHDDNKELGRGWTAKSKHSNATLFSEGKGKKKEITRDELDLKIKEFLDRGGKIDRMQNELRPSEFDTDEELREYTLDFTSKMRGSKEGQEGLSSFLDKRDANWKS